MLINKNKYSVFTRIYLIIYFVFIFLTILNDSEMQSMKDFNFYYEMIEVAFIMSNFLLILCSRNKLKIMFASVLVLFTISIYIIWRMQVISPFFLIIYLMIMNSNDHFFDSLSLSFIRTDLLSKLSSIMLVFLLGMVHFFPSVIILRNGIIPRYSFGFSNPNSVDLAILSLIISFLLLYLFYSKKGKLFIDIVLLVITIFYFVVLHYTHSNECFIAIVLLIVLLIVGNFHVLQSILCRMPLVIYFISVIASLYFTFFCHSSMFYDIDNISSDRLSGWIMSFSIYPVKLLGRTDLSLLGDYHPDIIGPSSSDHEFMIASLDNGYLSNLMRLGIIGLIILSIFIVYSLYKIEKSDIFLLYILYVVIFIVLLSVQYKMFYIFIPISLMISYHRKSLFYKNSIEKEK